MSSFRSLSRNRDVTRLDGAGGGVAQAVTDGLRRQLSLIPSLDSIERAVADVERLGASTWPLDLEHLFGSNAQIVGPQLWIGDAASSAPTTALAWREW